MLISQVGFNWEIIIVKIVRNESHVGRESEKATVLQNFPNVFISLLSAWRQVTKPPIWLCIHKIWH